MIQLGNNTARQFARHHVTKPWARAHVAVTTMTTYVIVAKAMCFVEGAP
jgi:hypothetical protein